MNKIMFWIGIASIVVAAILLIGNFKLDSAIAPVLGLLGVVLIGASEYRPWKENKK